MAQASIVLKQKIVNIQQYSNNTDKVDFYFDRYTSSGIDLSTLQAWILLDTVDVIISNLDESFCQSYNETQVKLEWTIDGYLTQKEREIPFQIVFTNGGDMKLYTTVGRLKVNGTIGIEEVIVPSHLSLFQQWLKKMETLAALIESGGAGGGGIPGDGGGTGSGSGGSSGGGSGDYSESLYISSIGTLYAINESGKEAPTSGWSKNKPNWVEGKYIWQKIVVNYKDGTSFYSDPTCIIGSENEYILNKVDFLNDLTNSEINNLRDLLDDLERDNIKVGTLSAHLANIDVANIGSLFVESLTAFTETVATSIINDAYIMNLVSDKITVADLNAKDALAERVVLVGSNTNPTIAFENGTQQFYDTSGNVRVQIGQDASGDFNFIVRGEDGTTALFDENGVTTNAIANGLIVNSMIANETISKDKIDFPIIEPNEFGGVDITQVYDGSGGKFGVEYESFKENVTSYTEKQDELEKEIIVITDTVKGVKQTVDNNTDAITNKIWQSDFAEEIDKYDEKITETIRNRIAENEQTLEGFKTTVSEDISKLKDWSTETWKTEAQQLIGKDYITSTVGEYYVSSDDLNEVVKNTETSINQSKEDIKLSVSDMFKDYSTTEQMNSAIELSATEITSTVSSVNNDLQQVKSVANQTSEKFNWIVKSVTDETNETNFELTDRTATLIAENINLNGLITFSGLGDDVKDKINFDGDRTNWDNAYSWINENGSNITDLRSMILKWTNNAVSEETYIQGGWIATNTITANQIAVEDLFAQDIIATGTITGANFIGATGTFTGSVNASKGKIGGWNMLSNCLYSKTPSSNNNESWTAILQNLNPNILSASDVNVSYGCTYYTDGDYIYVISNEDGSASLNVTLPLSGDGTYIVTLDYSDYYKDGLRSGSLEDRYEYFTGWDEDGNEEYEFGSSLFYVADSSTPYTPTFNGTYEYRFDINGSLSDGTMYLKLILDSVSANETYKFKIYLTKNGSTVKNTSPIYGVPADAVLAIKQNVNDTYAIPFYILRDGSLYSESSAEFTSLIADYIIKMKVHDGTIASLISTGENVDDPNSVWIDQDDVFDNLYIGTTTTRLTNLFAGYISTEQINIGDLLIDTSSTYCNFKSDNPIFKFNKDMQVDGYISCGDITANTLSATGGIDTKGNLLISNGSSIQSGGTNILFRTSTGDCTALGYGGYANNTDVTQIMGKSIMFYTKTPNTSWRPYYQPGDSVTVSVKVAGYISAKSAQVMFTIPLAKPIVGCSGVTVASSDGLIIRQEGSYCYGSTSDTWVKPSSYSATIQGQSCVVVDATFSNTTNVVNNNDSAGVQASIKITFT